MPLSVEQFLSMGSDPNTPKPPLAPTPPSIMEADLAAASGVVLEDDESDLLDG